MLQAPTDSDPRTNVDFAVNGKRFSLERADVERALSSVEPEEVRQYGVEVAGRVYPVKQALAAATGLARTEFQSMTARQQLGRLGLHLVTVEPAATATASTPTERAENSPPVSSPPVSADPHGWPWEGHVQGLFASHLVRSGWVLDEIADTATKAHGVDVLAHTDGRRLGAEVKGWPSRNYADPRRNAETKPTQPTLQAGHWFSQAIMKALMLLDSHPGRESLAVLPDFPRYRDLAHRTTTGLHRAGVHVVFVREDGSVASDTWQA